PQRPAARPDRQSALYVVREERCDHVPWRAGADVSPREYRRTGSSKIVNTGAIRGPPHPRGRRTHGTRERRARVATLTVLKFPEADGADRMISKLE
ncbi:MAG TPA: hypothetical protein VFE09_06995, partial [Rubrobacteraceae bacterium]|nr:hypothetical protein [Rubrobacteraceae bacterium]